VVVNLTSRSDAKRLHTLSCVNILKFSSVLIGTACAQISKVRAQTIDMNEIQK
jgi:hypothetical protein